MVLGPIPLPLAFESHKARNLPPSSLTPLFPGIKGKGLQISRESFFWQHLHVPTCMVSPWLNSKFNARYIKSFHLSFGSQEFPTPIINKHDLSAHLHYFRPFSSRSLPLVLQKGRRGGSDRIRQHVSARIPFCIKACIYRVP